MDPQISERLNDLYGLLNKAEELNTKNGKGNKLAKIGRKGDSNDTFEGLVDLPANTKPNKRQKVRVALRNTLMDQELHIKTLRDALDVVVDIRQTLRQYQKKLIATANSNQAVGGVRRGALMKILQQSASALPLFVPANQNDPVPPLCGCIPADQSYVAKAGDMVAAFVPSPDGDGSKVWVLGEVTQYILGAGKYEIEDIDEEQKERHLIGRRRVIPLPTMRANPLTNPWAIFPKDTLVLALYPQTTCFYRAIIDKPPNDQSSDYMVSFEDATYTEGYSPPLAVPQRYVIASREPKK